MNERVCQEMERVVQTALAEDVGSGDVTTEATVSADREAEGVLVARESLVVSGVAVAEAVFRAVSGALVFERLVKDGVRVDPGEVILRVTGSAAAILTGERVALNLLQHLSGVATVTRRFVEAVAGTGVRILDTRKTTPGLRGLEKQAVVDGGGFNHRIGLYDAILIKDNHLAALAGETDNPVGEAIRRVRERHPGWPVEVEADTVEQVRAGLAAGADLLLLDNMSLELLRESVQLARGRARTEASGGVTLGTVRAIAETGVDRISVGGLTHSARAVDVALDLRWSRARGAV